MAVKNDIEAPVPQLKVGILALPESTASTVFGMYDLFSATGTEWNLVMHGDPGPLLIDARIVAATAEGFRTPNNAWLQPDTGLTDVGALDVVCVPDLMVAPGTDISDRYHAERQWLIQQYEAGAALAAACTGGLLLAEAGLLDGKETTMHWAYCDSLARQYPKINVKPDRSLVASGEGHRLMMAGGGTSWLDLALLIIARFVDPEEAMRVARLFMIDWHQVGQMPYASLTRPRHAEDAVISKCQHWAARHYDHEAPVSAMTEMSGLSQRSFARRFSQATGMTPLEYIHTLRLEEAKHMLETGNAPVEAIADDVGYQDASFFRRLFRRKVGLTPLHYRKRFGALRRTLSDAVSDVPP